MSHHSRSTGVATVSFFQVHLLFGSMPLAVRLICTVVSVISRFVKKLLPDRSGCRHQRQNIVSTQLPPSDTEQFARSCATARVQ